MEFETKLIHTKGVDRVDGAVTQPIFQSSTFEYRGEKTYEAIRYIRLNNTPNHTALHSQLADLEGGEAALVTASGMAGISTALLSVVGRDEHLLCMRGGYGGTTHFIDGAFLDFGRQRSYFSGHDLSELQKLLTPKTKAIYIESVSNPLMRVCDFEAVIGFARANRLVALIDNTFPSPYNFQPMKLGFDVVLHSATKYLNGHSDIVAGAAISSNAWIKKMNELLVVLGGSLDPHACFLFSRGLKTLAVRMERQNQTALELAKALVSMPGVKKVYYPGLEEHPDYARARRHFRGFGGMVSLEFSGSIDAADRFMKNLKLAVVAPSLGGVETLVTRPSTTSHSSMSAEERQEAGISDTLVRVSVGLESAQDLIADFQQALRGVA